METIDFYDFDVTTGSSIQAEALFEIFDDLASIITGKRSSTGHSVEHTNQSKVINSQNKGYP